MLEQPKVEVKQKGLKIINILIIQYLLCFAGMGYGIALNNINIIMLFGVIMMFNAILQFRARAYKKEKF
jgi:hypothetical protein